MPGAETSRSSRTGAKGRARVESQFLKLEWGCEQTNESDIGNGIDLILFPRTEEGRETGQMLSAQVKTGSSSFSHPVKEDDSTIGWYFAEGNRGHLEYWAGRTMPHLIILHDIDSDSSYWVHLTAEAVVSTGVGWKIFVPASQQVDESSRTDLMKAASTGDAPHISLEGSIWTRAPSIGDASQWRYALIAPRLLAPHPNAGVGSLISPAQSVALIVQFRAADYERFASTHPSVPSLDTTTAEDAWGFRLASSLNEVLASGETSAIRNVLESAETGEQRAAAGVVLARALTEQGDLSGARHCLEQLLEDQDLQTIDESWIRIQLGRVLAEVGEVAESLEQTTRAQRTLEDETDPIARGLLASAVQNRWLVTGLFGQDDIGHLISRIDTRVNWWRWQQGFGAAARHIEESFDVWSQNKSVNLGPPDLLERELLAVKVSADLAGDHANCVAVSQLLATRELIIAHEARDEAGIGRALSELRRLGDHKSLDLATQRILRAGPVAAVQSAADLIDASTWTRSASLANLHLWSDAADVMSESSAEKAFEFCFEGLTNESHMFHKRASGGFGRHYELFKTAGDLLPAVGERFHIQLATWLVDRIGGESFGALMKQTARHISQRLLWKSFDEALLSKWARAADQLSDESPDLSSLIVSELARLHYRGAPERLVRLAQHGSLSALLEAGDLNITLPDDTIDDWRRRLKELIKKQMTDAHRGRFGFGGPNNCAAMCLLNLKNPNSADWESVLAFLRDPRMSRGEKEGVIEILLGNIDHLPDQTREDLREGLVEFEAAIEFPVRVRQGQTPSLALLNWRLGVSDHDSVLRWIIMNLLSRDPAERADAMLVLARATDIACPPEIAIGALADPMDDVREAAARAVAAGALNPGSEVLKAATVRGLQDTGRGVPVAILLELSRRDSTPDWLRDPLNALANHPSQHVRERLSRVTSGLGGEFRPRQVLKCVGPATG